MKKYLMLSALGVLVLGVGCAHKKSKVDPEDAVRFDRNLVKKAVVYEAGSKDGAVVPNVSAPQLRAVWVPERVEGNRLIEAHREWLLEGDVVLIGTPKEKVRNK